MARTLDRARPYVEVFGDVDESEKDKDGKPHVPHRFRQFGMLFDSNGELIGDEKDVPPEHEDEDMMRERLTREITAKVQKEFREHVAEVAKSGGGDGHVKAITHETNDLPGALGKAPPAPPRKKAA